MLGVSRLLAGSVTEADALRYKRQSGALPPHLLHYSEDKKPVVVWTSTQRCSTAPTATATPSTASTPAS
jgi:hypothetical protein